MNSIYFSSAFKSVQNWKFSRVKISPRTTSKFCSRFSLLVQTREQRNCIRALIAVLLTWPIIPHICSAFELVPNESTSKSLHLHVAHFVPRGHVEFRTQLAKRIMFHGNRMHSLKNVKWKIKLPRFACFTSSGSYKSFTFISLKLKRSFTSSLSQLLKHT